MPATLAGSAGPSRRRSHILRHQPPDRALKLLIFRHLPGSSGGIRGPGRFTSRRSECTFGRFVRAHGRSVGTHRASVRTLGNFVGTFQRFVGTAGSSEGTHSRSAGTHRSFGGTATSSVRTAGPFGRTYMLSELAPEKQSQRRDVVSGPLGRRHEHARGSGGAGPLDFALPFRPGAASLPPHTLLAPCRKLSPPFP
jgi:hypothetical protein